MVIHDTADSLAFHAPLVLGIDDWAMRNGRTSGTVWIDLARHRALALRPDREGKTVALG